MILLVGPSASGKTEVGKYLETKYGFKKVITYTTRQKRQNEVEEVDYHFIGKEEFLLLIEKKYFFETINYNGNYYGTALKDVTKQNYLIVDPNGVESYKNSELFTVSFFLDTPRQIRFERMISRGDDLADAKRRIGLDDERFDYNKIKGIDYKIEIENKTVAEVTLEIIEKYKSALNN